MTMRRWRFGEFQSQHDDITFAQMGYGRSIIVEGSDTNQEQSSFQVDGDNIRVNLSPGDTNFHYCAVEIQLAQLKAQLGQIPILISVGMNIFHDSNSSGTPTIEVRRFINPPTIANCSNRYRTRSTVPWYEDVFAPYHGQDVEDPPSSSQIVAFSDNSRIPIPIDIKPVIERALRDNVNPSFMLRSAIIGAGTLYVAYDGLGPGRWPYFDFTFLYPIEFYAATLAGEIDLTSVIDDNPGNEYYLGAVERGQTSAGTKGFFRNYTRETKQVEILDDHPENEDPVQRVGTGTGKLDYIVLADPAVSQLYTLEFYSSTQYEILAVAYRDNSISLHPQIDGDSQWRGSVGSDFTAPDGGLSIPAAAWQPGTLLNDEIEIAARGNTTNTDWPADSNDQVEITDDDSGTPKVANWRPVAGRRIKTAAAVTIDATTKLIPTRYVLETDWPIGTKAFVQNTADINDGQVKSVQVADIGTPVHNGTGTDDLTVSGNYNGTITDDYVVEIDAGGTPGTFQWSNDGGSTQQATGVVPTGSPQLLENGIYVQIPTGTNHDLGDTWTIPVEAFAVELEGLTADSTAYGPGAIVGTTLPFRDTAPAIYGQVNAASGVSETPPSRLYLDTTDGFVQGDEIVVEQAVFGSAASEIATIATGGVQATYLDLTAALTNDYPVGAFVTKTAFANNPFWMRIVAGSTTVEELKTLRLNARML